MQRWARQYAACVQCGGTDRKHFGKGLCRRCYLSQYNAANAVKVAALRKKWWLKMGGLDYARLQREQRHYDGLREPVLQRDRYKCVRCGSTEDLTVHHKDGNGRNMPPDAKNNRMENLETVCRPCHMQIHMPKIRSALYSKYRPYWSWRWKLKACIACGRSDRKHERDGYCATCWARERKMRIAAGTYTKANRKGKYVQ